MASGRYWRERNYVLKREWTDGLRNEDTVYSNPERKMPDITMFFLRVMLSVSITNSGYDSVTRSRMIVMTPVLTKKPG